MDTGFFKWVWRFNALAIAALVAFALIMLSKDFYRSMSRSVSAPSTVNIDPTDESIEEVLSIGQATFVKQTGLIHFSLLRSQSYDASGYRSGGFSSGKSTYDNVVNKGFLDPESGETRWLLESSDGLIVWESTVTRGEDDDARQIAALFLHVTEDTSMDRRLSSSDRGALLVSDPDGTRPVMLLDDVGGLKKSMELDSDTQVLDLVQGGKRRLVFVSLVTRQVVKIIDLPDV